MPWFVAVFLLNSGPPFQVDCIGSCAAPVAGQKCQNNKKDLRVYSSFLMTYGLGMKLHKTYFIVV